MDGGGLGLLLPGREAPPPPRRRAADPRAGLVAGRDDGAGPGPAERDQLREGHRRRPPAGRADRPGYGHRRPDRLPDPARPPMLRPPPPAPGSPAGARPASTTWSSAGRGPPAGTWRAGPTPGCAPSAPRGWPLSLPRRPG